MSKVIYIDKTDIGATLTTWIYCAMWQMWAAEQLGYDAYINWPDNRKPGRCLKDLIDKEQFTKQDNMFEWYFKQPKVERPTGTPKFISTDEWWTWETWKDPSPVPFMSQPLHIIKDYYKKNLIFSEEVEVRGAELVAKYNIDFSKTIGITWRGTDNITDGRPRMPIGAYFPFIDELLEKDSALRLMCTAEEDGILDPLLKRYSNSFKVGEFYQSPFQHKQNPERFSPVSGFERGMQPALMVWLFSKCAHYIKNRSSTGAVASWLSDGRIVSLGHPENLGFPANNDYAEIEGKLYPLYDYGKT